MNNKTVKSSISNFQFFANLLLISVVFAKHLKDSLPIQLLVGLCLFSGLFFSIKIFLKLKENVNHHTKLMLYQYFGICLFVSLVFILFSFYDVSRTIAVFLAVSGAVLLLYRFTIDYKLAKTDNFLK